MQSVFTFKRMLLFLIGTILFVFLAEITLQALGYKTASYSNASTHPNMKLKDHVLGWRLPVGSHVIPPYHISGDTTNVTVANNGIRITSKNDSIASNAPLILLGDHHTFGWAVNDEDTFAWKLQESLQGIKVENLAVPGYTAYQLMLTLENFKDQRQVGGTVLYEFNKYTSIRNLGPGNLIKMIYNFYDGGDTEIPYVKRNEKGKLDRCPPIEFRMPLAKQSVLAKAFYRRYLTWNNERMTDEGEEVMELLYKEMDSISKAKGAVFKVLFLEPNQENKYQQQVLNELGIPYLDCSLELTNELVITGDGAANRKAHALWAACISSKIKDSFE